MSKVRPLMVGAAWLLVGALAVGCSGDDTKVADGDDDSKRTTTTDESGSGGSDDESGSTTTPGSTTTTTSPFGDTIDLTDAPSLLQATNTAAFYFDDLAEPAEYRAGPLEQGEAYLISTDSSLVAVMTPGDAVRPTRIEMISVESGESVQSFDSDVDRLTITEWSPDNEALLASVDNAWVVYRLDGTTQEVVNSTSTRPTWTRGADGTSAVDCENCQAFQLTDSSGEPVAGVIDRSSPDRVSGLYDPDSQNVTPFSGAWGAGETNLDACEAFTIATARIDGESATGLLDVETGKIHTIEAVAPNTCPVVSIDGSLAAVALADGGAAVVDTATGTATSVARQGVPLAWSKDGEKLVVQGNGTFVVAADGSGGKEASVTIRSLCAIGSNGVVLAEVTGSTSESSGLAVYDVGKDSASLVGPFNIGRTCDVSNDGGWVLTGRVLVDLAGRRATLLRRPDPDGKDVGGEMFLPDPLWQSPLVVTGG